MITPFVASIIVLAICFILMFLVQFLDGSERFGKYISLRWVCLSIFLALSVGCVIDFDFLQESTRNLVIGGTIALAFIFIAGRSFGSKSKSKIQLKGVDATIAGQKVKFDDITFTPQDTDKGSDIDKSE